jgi:hypothetical protein
LRRRQKSVLEILLPANPEETEAYNRNEWGDVILRMT